MERMSNSRSSGILLHITSLPSAYGIGDLGPEAYRFVDFLKQAGQRYWQILPLNPIDAGSGNSPYSSPSAFAGNIYLISPEYLVRDGYLTKKEIKPKTPFKENYTDYDRVFQYKRGLFELAYENFKSLGDEKKEEWRAFCRYNSAWLDDYALYKALKKKHKFHSWVHWPDEFKTRHEQVLRQAAFEMGDEIDKRKFYQFLFFKQWFDLKKYANAHGIELFGDLPFYVSHDSVDVWVHRQIFKLDEHGGPTVVSGVPPDYFSETGQLWGTPVYDWQQLKTSNFWWWVQRIHHNLATVDLLRMDHFRAFSAYWEVPAGDENAIGGKWVETPGYELFDTLKQHFPSLPFVAEDLGEINQPVRDLMNHYNFPGMKVLLFAFGDDMPQNPYIPHNHIKNCLVYTGTHDNNTVAGWFKNEATPADKKRLEQYSGHTVNAKNVHTVLHGMILPSVADIIILPMQDILGLGQDARMNQPSASQGNWTWRVEKKYLTKALANDLKQKGENFGRC